MGWLLSGTASDEAPAHQVVSVRRADTDRIAGGGVVVGTGTVLTCAHVVNAALGRSSFDPHDPGLGTIPVHLHGRLGSRRHDAQVEHWIPPRSTKGQQVRAGDRTWLGDLAVPRLEGASGDLPAPPDRTAMTLHQRAPAWHGGGNEASFAEVTVTMIAGPVGYVDGAPIPWQRIEDELRPLGVLESVASDPVDPDDPGLADDARLPGPRDTGRRVPLIRYAPGCRAPRFVPSPAPRLRRTTP